MLQPRNIPLVDFQAAAEKNPPGYWTPAMIAYILAGGVHSIFREKVYVDQNETPTPATKDKFKLTMSNGDSFWVTVTPARGNT